MENKYLNFLSGGGEMGKLIRAFDWKATPIGAPDQWPASLLSAVSMMLHSRFPMFIWWGPELIQFYNDAYRPSLGNNGKHPLALGSRGEDTWREIWPVIKPLIDEVLAGGASTWMEDQLIPIYRNGKLEDVYWTFSYSKLPDNEGNIGGVLVTCTETTDQVKALSTMKHAKSELDFAISAARLATWDLDPTTFRFMGNKRIKEWFGLNESDEIELSKAVEVIAEEDRERVTKAIETAMTYASGGQYNIEYYIKNPDSDRPRLVKAVGRAIFNEQQQPVRFSGTLQDITDEQNAITKMKEAHHKLELTLEQTRLAQSAAKLGTFDLDLISGHLEWDARCRELFGIMHDREVTYQEDFVNRLHPEDRERTLQKISDSLDKDKSNGDYDVAYRTVAEDDGRIRWVSAKGKTFFDDNKIPLRLIGSVIDITEQKNDELRKNDFIGMVSHELKTPLTSLKSFTQILESKAQQAGDEFTRNVLGKSNLQIRKMEHLINGFLDVSRLESGKINLELELVQLNEIIDQVIGDSQLISSTHNITRKPCGPIAVMADAFKITSVIANLLGNATKYSKIGSSIEISCRKEKDFVRVSVRDEGIGISPLETGKLFDRFYRVDGAPGNSVPGFGIGLYLSAEIIRRHNGEIGVESTPDKGSTFFFTLPVSE